MPAVTPKHIPGPNPPATIGKNTEKRKRDTHEQLVSVWSRDGIKQVVEQHQANDLVRHCGFSRTPPKGAVEAEDPKPKDAKPEGEAEEEVKPPKEPDELDILRAQYTEVSGEQPDMRWGKKKLTEELEKHEK